MKKKINNKGFTLIEVVVATVILAIISAPIIGFLIQTEKFNLSSDVEIRLKATAEKIIEEVKANKGDLGLVGLADGSDSNYYVNGVYFNSQFNIVPSNDLSKMYKLTADKSVFNYIDTNGQYDRWDFRFEISQDPSSLNAQVAIYNNTGVYTAGLTDPTQIAQYQAAQGKLYGASLLPNVWHNIGNSMVVDFAGKVDATTTPYKFNYTINGLTGLSLAYPFKPGFGEITPGENIIVVNVNRTNNAPAINLDVKNDTFYNGSLSSFYTKTVGSNTIFQYWNHIILNVFNDNSANPAINVTTSSPYVTVNRSTNVLPALKNGYKINIKVDQVDPVTGNTIKTVKIIPSVVE